MQKITLMGIDCPTALARRRFGWIRLLVFRRVSAVIATASEQAKDCEAARVRPEIVRLIPNAVDTARFKPTVGDEKLTARQALNIPDDVPVAVMLGKIGRRKGVDVLCRAWCSVRKVLPEAQLILAGPLEEPLPCEAGLRHIGAIAAPETVLKAADVFVLPSRSEGFPNAVLEAMATGLCCVLSPAAAGHIAIEGESAYVVAPEDADGLGIALLKALTDRETSFRFGRNAFDRVRGSCSLAIVAEAYAALYEEIRGARV